MPADDPSRVAGAEPTPVAFEPDSACCADPLLGRSGVLRFGARQVLVSENHFKKIDEAARQRVLFRHSVKRVAVEVSSHCNRQCEFCPNADGGRKGENLELPEVMFLRLLDDLAEVGFMGGFCFHQYNEPLYDAPLILSRVQQARTRLPNAHLFIHTNGDYLSRQLLLELADAGLDEIHVAFYPPRLRAGDRDFGRRRIRARCRRLRLGAGQWVKESEHAILWRTRLGRLEVGMAWRDFRVVGQDRGGLVACTKAVARRVSPCFTMFQDIDIDYRGNMVVCCNIYPDSPSHGDYVLGNLGAADSVFRIYANRKSAAWRRQLLRFRPAPPPCVRCNRFENPADYSAEAEAAIGRMMLWLDTHQATDGQVAALSCGRGAP